MRPAPTLCPACEGPLHIARLACERCGTAVEGQFGTGRLGRLSREEIAFVEVFLECRGKIKDVEHRLGVSYPTVVARLEQVVAALGPSPARSQTPSTAATDDILDALSKGSITPEEAARRLRKRPKEK